MASVQRCLRDGIFALGHWALMSKKLFFYRATLVALASLAARLSVRLTESAYASKRSLTQSAQSVCAGPVIGIAPLGAGVVRGQTTAVGVSVMVDCQGELTGFLPGTCVHAYVGLQFIFGIDAPRRSGQNTTQDDHCRRRRDESATHADLGVSDAPDPERGLKHLIDSQIH